MSETIKIKVDPTIDILATLNLNGSKLYKAGGSVYYFLPYWFEENEEGLFMHMLGNLPKELEDLIIGFRDIETQLDGDQ